MAYVVTDAAGRREFRWYEGGRVRSRRLPRGEAGDRLLAELQAAREAEAAPRHAARDADAARGAETEALLRDLDDFGE